MLEVMVRKEVARQAAAPEIRRDFGQPPLQILVPTLQTAELHAHADAHT